jgi:hypothetical protein
VQTDPSFLSVESRLIGKLVEQIDARRIRAAIGPATRDHADAGWFGTGWARNGSLARACPDILSVSAAFERLLNGDDRTHFPQGVHDSHDEIE